MALPPTRLTSLLYSVRFTVPSAIAVLEENGCLSDKALRDRASLTTWLEGIIVEHHEKMRGMTGPNAVDVAAKVLLEHGFLSKKGKQFCNPQR